MLMVELAIIVFELRSLEFWTQFHIYEFFYVARSRNWEFNTLLLYWYGKTEQPLVVFFWLHFRSLACRTWISLRNYSSSKNSIIQSCRSKRSIRIAKVVSFWRLLFFFNNLCISNNTGLRLQLLSRSLVFCPLIR